MHLAGYLRGGGGDRFDEHRLDPGEIAKVRQALAEGIRAFWPAQESAGDIPEERRIRQ